MGAAIEAAIWKWYGAAIGAAIWRWYRAAKYLAQN